MSGYTRDSICWIVTVLALVFVIFTLSSCASAEWREQNAIEARKLELEKAESWLTVQYYLENGYRYIPAQSTEGYWEKPNE